MAQDTTLQVIELQQLPIIVERLHSVKADIEQRTAEAIIVADEKFYIIAQSDELRVSHAIPIQ